MHLKVSSGKWRPFCLGLNVLKLNDHFHHACGQLFNTISHASSLTHYCLAMPYTVIKFLIIGSGNGLPPVWCQVVTWTDALSSAIGPPKTYSEIQMKIQELYFTKMLLKMSSEKWWPICQSTIHPYSSELFHWHFGQLYDNPSDGELTSWRIFENRLVPNKSKPHHCTNHVHNF